MFSSSAQLIEYLKKENSSKFSQVFKVFLSPKVFTHGQNSGRPFVGEGSRRYMKLPNLEEQNTTQNVTAGWGFLAYMLIFIFLIV